MLSNHLSKSAIAAISMLTTAQVVPATPDSDFSLPSSEEWSIEKSDIYRRQKLIETLRTSLTELPDYILKRWEIIEKPILTDPFKSSLGSEGKFSTKLTNTELKGIVELHNQIAIAVSQKQRFEKLRSEAINTLGSDYSHPTWLRKEIELQIALIDTTRNNWKSHKDGSWELKIENLIARSGNLKRLSGLASDLDLSERNLNLFAARLGIEEVDLEVQKFRLLLNYFRQGPKADQTIFGFCSIVEAQTPQICGSLSALISNKEEKSNRRQHIQNKLKKASPLIKASLELGVTLWIGASLLTALYYRRISRH